jgi:hypothetical protein
MAKTINQKIAKAFKEIGAEEHPANYSPKSKMLLKDGAEQTGKYCKRVDYAQKATQGSQSTYREKYALV